MALLVVDVGANCGNGYQGDEGRSDGTDVASISGDAQGGTYHEAVGRLLGNETEPYSDPYSASGEGYEEAVAQLEAEAAERTRQAQVETETAEQQRRANSYPVIRTLLELIIMLASFP